MNTEQDAYVPGMEHEGITVFMMGTVMVEYNRKPMPLMGNPQGKMLQLFLILLYAGDKGVLREELLDMLYGNGENTNPSGSLRAAVFRLRKTLEGCGLPEHEYIRTDSGIYRWDGGGVPVYIDAKDFEITAHKALKQRDESLLKKACGLYQGEFMAQLAGERWVSIIGVRYQELYFDCLRMAYYIMKDNREYTDLLELASDACDLYPYEECQIMKIDCLIAMKRFTDAMQVYDQAVTQYFEEQGLPPSEKMLERFRTMSGQIRYTSDTLKDIRDSLHERDRVNGPYYCSYPAFIDCYRLLVRMSERIDFTNVLLCCTLLDSKGKPLDTGGELLKAASSKLHEAIGNSIRKGDVFTCYNPSQYLVMLNGTSQEYCLRIFERIDRNLHLWDGGRRVKLNYQVMPESLL